MIYEDKHLNRVVTTVGLPNKFIYNQSMFYANEMCAVYKSIIAYKFTYLYRLNKTERVCIANNKKHRIINRQLYILCLLKSYKILVYIFLIFCFFIFLHFATRLN